MIAAYDLLIDQGVLDPIRKSAAREEIVYAPADVLFTRTEHIAPPGVGGFV